MVKTCAFGFVGVQPTSRTAATPSASQTKQKMDCKQLIQKFRTVSGQENMRVLVGGTAVGAGESFSKQVGADGSADDAYEAMILADLLCGGKQLDKELIVND